MDLKQLEKQLDEALESETRESLIKWLDEQRNMLVETTASDISDNVVGRIIADENSDCATCCFYPCPYQKRYGYKYMAKGKCSDHSARTSF